jgi:hypothetical protein
MPQPHCKSDLAASSIDLGRLGEENTRQPGQASRTGKRLWSCQQWPTPVTLRPEDSACRRLHFGSTMEFKILPAAAFCNELPLAHGLVRSIENLAR